MQYSRLVEVYEKLESVPGKIEKTNIIARLLSQASIDDLEQVVLLLYGRVFPSWSEKELGIANQLMIKAIAKACGVGSENVVSQFNKTGDLGTTVEQLMKTTKQKRLTKVILTVDKVFTNLQKIAEQEGEGTVDRKISLIAELISQASPEEAKYIVRTTLEELRVGVAEGLIRDAIAQAFNVPAEKVEHAWFLNQDYGTIAKMIKKGGAQALKKIKIEIGKPVAVLLGEKAPNLEEAIKSYKHTAIEKKYDGMRAQIHKNGTQIWIYTRRMENVTKQFPDVVELVHKYIKSDKVILEGEIIGLDPKTRKPLPFQHLSKRIKRKYDIEKMVKMIPIQVNFFDIIYLDGKTFFTIPFRERRQTLEKVVKAVPEKFKLAEHIETNDLAIAEKFYKNALEEGQEGVMVKNLEAQYVPGRTVEGGWLKVKPTLENLDLVIIGATWGTGKRVGVLGSYVLACREEDSGRFLECGMLGTGVKEKKTAEEDVTMEELTKMLKTYIISESGNTVKIKPKIVIEVAYEEIQKSSAYSSGFALRFPRFVRLREKGPEQADSLERIKKIFEMQKGRKGS